MRNCASSFSVKEENDYSSKCQYTMTKVKLLTTIKAATEIAERFDSALADKKVTLMELVGFMGEMGNIQLLVTDGKAALKEYVEATNEEREEALNYLAAELQLNNHEVDAKIDATIAHLARIETSLRNVISAFQGIKNTWA